MRRILIETTPTFEYISPVGSFSPLENMANLTAALVKTYDNGIEVYRAPFNRLLIIVPETHPLYGFYAINFGRNNYYIADDTFTEDKQAAVERVVRGVLSNLK